MVKKPLFLLVLLVLGSALWASELKIQKGVINDPVQSAFDAKQSHAIYLPSAYTPEKRWPILFCYDPRGQGKVVTELYREAAERLGWIIFSSNNSRSDDPKHDNLVVLNAMWSDSHKWLSLDEKRIYATGFSGGARLAWGMGYVYPKSTAGVIGVGAGTHYERPATKDTTFAWYGIVGNKDFNYLEVNKVGETLGSFQLPNRVESFPGPHSWPPAEYCSRALDWMELQAMKRDRRPKDAAWIQQQFEKRKADAVQLESSNSFQAYLKYKHLVEDFQGLLEIGDVPERLSRLANSDAVKKEMELRKKVAEKEQKQLEALQTILRAFPNSAEIPTARKLKSDLKIEHYQDEAKEKGDTEEGLLSQRLLETIFSQTAFYLPQYLLEKKDFDRSIVSLSVGSEIHPEYPWVWFNIATAYIQDGDKKKTLESLQMAVDRGLKERKWIDQEKSFDPIRNDPDFQKIVSSIPSDNK